MIDLKLIMISIYGYFIGTTICLLIHDIKIKKRLDEIENKVDLLIKLL